MDPHAWGPIWQKLFAKIGPPQSGTLMCVYGYMDVALIIITNQLTIQGVWLST